jgi:glycosyltransferase involved in cell wall biosynthesis
MMPGRIDFFLLTEQMDHRHYVLAHGQNGLPVLPLRGWRWPRPPHDDLHLNDVRPVLRGKYDTVILGGWDEPTYLLLWMWAVFQRRRVIFWVESTGKDNPRRGMKEKFKRVLLKRASGCIVPGQNASVYCQQLGVPGARIFTAPNSADRSYFRKAADRMLPLRSAMRLEAGLDGLVILFVGRLVEALKGVSALIRACGQLQRDKKKVSLLLAGDGPDRKSYEGLIREEKLLGVRFLGTLDREKLCRYYAIADVLVQPSHSEPWGFILNEGMEFGLPLVVSEAVGAGPDLVNPGLNGFVFPVGDVSSLAHILQNFLKNEELRLKMGEASRTIVERFSPENWAEGVIKAIKSVTPEA